VITNSQRKTHQQHPAPRYCKFIKSKRQILCTNVHTHSPHPSTISTKMDGIHTLKRLQLTSDLDFIKQKLLKWEFFNHVKS
jgi:hypothetical protein